VHVKEFASHKVLQVSLCRRSHQVTAYARGAGIRGHAPHATGYCSYAALSQQGLPPVTPPVATPMAARVSTDIADNAAALLADVQARGLGCHWQQQRPDLSAVAPRDAQSVDRPGVESSSAVVARRVQTPDRDADPVEPESSELLGSHKPRGARPAKSARADQPRRGGASHGRTVSWAGKEDFSPVVASLPAPASSSWADGDADSAPAEAAAGSDEAAHVPLRRRTSSSSSAVTVESADEIAAIPQRQRLSSSSSLDAGVISLQPLQLRSRSQSEATTGVTLVNPAERSRSPNATPSPSLLQRRQRQGYKAISIGTMSIAKAAVPSEEQPSDVCRQRSMSEDAFEPKVILERPSLDGSNPPPRRSFPGAFPHQRTVFFFDWDDTLCPTTWIRSALKGLIDERLEWDTKAVETMEDWRDMIPQWFRHKLPDDQNFVEQMKDLQQKAINVIRQAQQFGVVCIVTNSLPGWVDMTVKKYLPLLTQYIHGHGMASPPIRVLYSQQVQLRAPGDLTWVPDGDEFALMKRDAMSLALHEVEDLYRMADEVETGIGGRFSWCSSRDTKRVTNIVSIGNDEAEMRAGELATLGYSIWRQSRKEGKGPRTSQQPGVPPPRWRSPRAYSAHRSDRELPGRPWLKLVKFTDCPKLRELTAHLEEVTALIPELAGSEGHSRRDLEARPSSGAPPPTTRFKPGRRSTKLKPVPLAKVLDCGLFAQTV